MKIADRLARISEILPELQEAWEKRNWERVSVCTKGIRTHIDVMMEFSDEVRATIPQAPAAAVLPPLPKKPVRRLPRKDKGIPRIPATQEIHAKIGDMKPGDSLVLNVPDNIEDGRDYQSSVASVAAVVWGDGNYRTIYERETREVLLWRGK